MAKTAKYRVRIPYKEGEELLSEAEILRRIVEGKYTGDEHVASEDAPAGTWQVLSSHPRFYDALLRKLFGEEYRIGEPFPPAGKTSRTKRRQATSARPTRQGVAGEGDAADRDRNTQRLHQGAAEQEALAREPAGTVRQSLLDDLFSDGGKAADRKTGSAMIPVGGTTAVIEAPLDHAESGPEVSPPSPFAAPASPGAPRTDPSESKAKRLRLALVAVLVVALWYATQGDRPAEKPTDEAEAGSIDRKSLNAELSDELKKLKRASLLSEGDQLYQQDTAVFLRGALLSYREADTVSEADPKVLGRIAVAAARLSQAEPTEQNFAVARDAIARGRRIDPQASAFYRAEAMIAIAEGRHADAKQTIYNAIETDPMEPDNAVVLAEASVFLGERAVARSAVEQAARAMPSLVRARHLAAQLALDAGDVDRARAEALAAIQVNPLHAASYAVVGRIAAASGQLNEARGLLETCVRLARFAPQEVVGSAYVLLAKLQRQLGAANEAALSARLAVHYAPNNEDAKKAADGLDTSPSALRKLAQEVEYGPAYFREQAEAFRAEGRLREAFRFYQAAALLADNGAQDWIRLGEIAEKASPTHDDFLLATALYERALERDPRLARAYVRLGVIETDQYNWNRAIRLLKQAVALAPNEAEPYVALARFHYKRRDYQESLKQLLEAKRLDPREPEVYFYAGKLRLVVKKDAVKDAMVHFEDAYKLDPGNYEAMAEWLKLKAMSNEKNFALKFVNVLLEQQPNNPELYWVQGEIYAAASENRRAIASFHRALDLDNRMSRVRMSLGAALEAVGEIEKAIPEYRLASQLDRRNADGYYKAAELLVLAREYNAGEEILRTLVARTPNYPGAHRLISKIYRVRRDKDKAITAMLREVQNNPENMKFVVELAELYMEYEQYDDAIRQLAKVANLPSVVKAPEFYQDKVRAFLLLSRCYRAKNQAESAEGAIKLAVELDPNDPEIQKELGYVYYGLQRDKEAVRAFERYLERNPAAADAETIKALIDRLRIEE
jgi:tetratricopeptide (TPR) repeat protein